MARTVSVLGCGWLGLPLAQRLLADGYVVKGSTTTPEKIPVLAQQGILPYLIRLTPQPTDDLSGFLQADILVIDIPPKASAQGSGFHPAQIQAVVDAVHNSTVQQIIYISSTSVYPEYSRLVTEADVITPADSAAPAGSPGQLVVAEQIVGRLAPGRQVTVLRCAGLMGYDRIPGKYVTGRTIDSGSLPVNYIHRDDAVGLIGNVITNQLTGTYNVVAPLHPTREAVYRQSCVLFDYPLPSFVSPIAPQPFKIISGEKLGSQLVYNFRYPDPLTFQYSTTI